MTEPGRINYQVNLSPQLDHPPQHSQLVMVRKLHGDIEHRMKVERSVVLTQRQVKALQ